MGRTMTKTTTAANRNGRHVTTTSVPLGPQTNGIVYADAIRHGNLVTTWEYITPELAEKYKAKMGRNRTFMPTYAAGVAADMASGDWHETHQGIAFNELDECVDAQHRLDGVIQSGKSQWFLVTRGLSQAAVEAIDRGRVRSLAHTMQIMGYDTLADYRAVAMARSMMTGPAYNRGVRRPTLIEVRKFIDQYHEPLTFVTTLPGYHALPSGVTGVLARAYLHVPPAELTRFASAMADEIPVEQTRPGDKVARSLMTGLMRDRQQGGSGRVLVYQRTQNALKAYLAGEDKKMIKGTAEDLYPLPVVEAVVEAVA